MKVRVEQLTKQFGTKGVPAVHGATFDGADGGITTLLGPSGSGKTTILRIIAGLETADDGRVLVGDEDIIDIPARKRGFGFVFQNFALFDHMSVRENIAFGLRVRRTGKADIASRVDELLGLVQLEGFGDRYPGQLSGGQRQRVGFARALAPQPRLLLLDEPFGALDARVRAELREWLRRLHDVTHLTTVMVTHDQEEALDLSDRLVVMDRGKIQQVGTPREVYESPATSFVASFVGSANVLRGQVLRGRAQFASTSVNVSGSISDGVRVSAVVRPHDIRIARPQTERDPSAEPQRVIGRIKRIVDLGTHVKVDLGLTTHELVTVHVSRREFETLALLQGESVLVDLDSARVFVDDYSV
jgi:sulfate/thiosulfate transport system ATP-binding protein